MESANEERNRLRALDAALRRRPWLEVERAFAGTDEPTITLSDVTFDGGIEIAEVRSIKDVD